MIGARETILLAHLNRSMQSTSLTSKSMNSIGNFEFQNFRFQKMDRLSKFLNFFHFSNNANNGFHLFEDSGVKFRAIGYFVHRLILIYRHRPLQKLPYRLHCGSSEAAAICCSSTAFSQFFRCFPVTSRCSQYARNLRCGDCLIDFVLESKIWKSSQKCRPVWWPCVGGFDAWARGVKCCTANCRPSRKANGFF